MLMPVPLQSDGKQPLLQIKRILKMLEASFQVYICLPPRCSKPTGRYFAWRTRTKEQDNLNMPVRLQSSYAGEVPIEKNISVCYGGNKIKPENIKKIECDRFHCGRRVLGSPEGLKVWYIIWRQIYCHMAANELCPGKSTKVHCNWIWLFHGWLMCSCCW